MRLSPAQACQVRGRVERNMDTTDIDSGLDELRDTSRGYVENGMLLHGTIPTETSERFTIEDIKNLATSAAGDGRKRAAEDDAGAAASKPRTGDTDASDKEFAEYAEPPKASGALRIYRIYSKKASGKEKAAAAAKEEAVPETPSGDAASPQRRVPRDVVKRWSDSEEAIYYEDFVDINYMRSDASGSYNIFERLKPLFWTIQSLDWSNTADDNGAHDALFVDRTRVETHTLIDMKEFYETYTGNLTPDMFEGRMRDDAIENLVRESPDKTFSSMPALFNSYWEPEDPYAIFSLMKVCWQGRGAARATDH